MSHLSDARIATVQSQVHQNAEEVSSLPSSPDQIVHEEHAPAPPPQVSPSEASHSDSGFSLSSSSSGEVTGTPFDFGTQRYEYPFPPTQGTSSDPFLPLSSSITITSPSNSIWPLWPTQVTKSFPLTPPTPRKVRTHPKLRSVAAREPPVPPSLANKRSFWSLSLQRQTSAESQQSDLGDIQTRGRKLLPGGVGFTEADAYSASDSEITVRRRQPSAYAVYASSSRMDSSEGVANQNGLMTCGGRAPEVPVAGAPASGPGLNGGHNKLDLRPGNPPNRGNVPSSSVGEVLRIVAGRLLNWVLRFFLGS
ncbi:uncharacterized protein EDB93DRAFT_516935 [Suillus bovinus]|uniref:uncharacterized protein n=1 Tax=Suillus bovinus TaxID=48563 RepID=UPI001B884F24|nr:uncharacterized protein EDB93DRAFT_516935 [Suillus bovinus]KAG2145347.1 hypothetical protein EDB93DRAFT_516935 [Suillus bovinus]